MTPPSDRANISRVIGLLCWAPVVRSVRVGVVRVVLIGSVLAALAAPGAAARFTVTQLTVPNRGAPNALAAGPDGNLWGSQGGAITRISASGRTRTFLPAHFGSEGPGSITAGPDGSMWFTVDLSPVEASRFGSFVGRVTPSGTITQWRVPGAEITFTGIAAGADGNLWFAGDQGELGRVTPKGRITIFDPWMFTPWGIAPGPDGNVWFVDDPDGRSDAPFYEPGHVGEITKRGKITSYPAIGAGAIAPGANGTVWLATQSAVIRVSQTHKLKTYRLAAGQSALAITPGPDGNEWFDNAIVSFEKGGPYYNKSGFGFISPTHGVSDQPLGNFPMTSIPIKPEQLAAGPDGNIWIAEIDPITNTYLARVNLGLRPAPPATATSAPNAPVAHRTATLAISCHTRPGRFCEGTATLHFTNAIPPARSAKFYIPGELSRDVPIPLDPRAVKAIGGGSIVAKLTLALSAYGQHTSTTTQVRLAPGTG